MILKNSLFITSKIDSSLWGLKVFVTLPSTMANEGSKRPAVKAEKPAIPNITLFLPFRVLKNLDRGTEF